MTLLDAEGQALVLEHRWLARHAAGRWRGLAAMIGADDVLGHAELFLCEIVALRDPASPVDLRAEIAHRLWCRLSDLYRRHRRRRNVAYAADPPDPPAAADRAPADLPRDWAEGLTRRQRDAVDRYYFRGMTDREIAAASGLTRQAVAKARAKALAALLATVPDPF